MKERFIERYKNTILSYFNYKGSGEGKRAIIYVMNEYENILQEEFGLTHEEVRCIYNELYDKQYIMEV